MSRAVGASLLVWAAAVLLVAYVAICLHTHSAWPWGLVVHEDGTRTLIGTILYFEHATRELPLDILLGVAIGGCVFLAFPPDGRGEGRGAAAGRAAALTWTAALVMAVILGGAAAQGGLTLVLDNLLQNHTRAGAPLVWGSHWRYHLLERLALILVSVGVAGLLRCFFVGERGAPSRPGLLVVAGSIAVYGVLTIVFSGGWPSLRQPFHDPQYLGHQARELFTHALVTVPAGWAGGLLARRSGGRAVAARPRPRPGSWPATVTATTVAGALGVLMAGYVGVAALAAGSVSHGQTKDLVILIFPHFFEHSFTYVVVPLVAALAYELTARPGRAREAVRAATRERT